MLLIKKENLNKLEFILSEKTYVDILGKITTGNRIRVDFNDHQWICR